MDLLGGARPFVYISALTGGGKAIDIGVQVGFEGEETAFKAMTLPAEDWTWETRAAIVEDTDVFMQFELINGRSVFQLWTGGFGVGEPVWKGSSSVGRWAGPWARFAFVTSIGVPKNETRLFDDGTEGWICGVDWLVREIKIGGAWKKLASGHVNSLGAYPQRNNQLNTAGEKWLFESPIYVGPAEGASTGSSNETVTIDMRRAKGLF